jgi:adenylate kinase
MKMLNEEFNYYRSLFPLKVFITGPPCSGKTHFASRLNEMYGVPHIKIQDIVDMGKNLNTDYGDVVRARVEELKDHAEADYEKSKKKKDPEFDRASCNPRLPDDILHELVKIYLNSAGCMNKGFILEGFPRSEADAKQIFMNKIQIQKPETVEG